MKTLKIWIFITITIVLFSECNAIEMAFNLNGHRSGMYIEHKDSSTGSYTHGIAPMFQTIGDDAAIYGLFHFKHNSFAADIAKMMLETALKTKHPNGGGKNVNWKLFLETELENIEKRLMQKNLTKTEAKSETEVSIVIIDENRITQAIVGNGRIALFVKNPSLHSCDKMCLRDKNRPINRNKLGGQSDKVKYSNVWERADVYEIKDDVKYIILGTDHFWFANAHDITKSINVNENNLIDAAHEITHLFRPPNWECDNGVIVIGMGYPKIERKKSLVRSLSCCINPVVKN